MVVVVHFSNEKGCNRTRCYYFYTKKEVRQLAKQYGKNEGMTEMFIEDFNELYYRHGSRWFKV